MSTPEKADSTALPKSAEGKQDNAKSINPLLFCTKCELPAQGNYCQQCGRSLVSTDHKQQPPAESRTKETTIHYYSFPRISDGDTGITIPAFSFFSTPAPSRPVELGPFFCKACQVQSGTSTCLQCGARKPALPRSPSPLLTVPSIKPLHPTSPSSSDIQTPTPSPLPSSRSESKLSGSNGRRYSLLSNENKAEAKDSEPRPRAPQVDRGTYFSFPRIQDEQISFSAVLGTTSEAAESELHLSASTTGPSASVATRPRTTTLPRRESSMSVVEEFEQRLDGLNSRDRANWMSDKSCKYCYECQTPFTFFKRRHHCRLCGQIFCHRCSSMTVNSTNGAVRVCRHCSTLASKFQQVSAPVAKKPEIAPLPPTPNFEVAPPPMCPARCGCPVGSPFDECTCSQCKPGQKARTRDPNQQLGLFREDEDEESDVDDDSKEGKGTQGFFPPSTDPVAPAPSTSSGAEGVPIDEVTEDKEEEEGEDLFSNFKAAVEAEAGQQEEDEAKRKDDRAQGTNERALARLESYYKFQKLAYYHLSYATSMMLLGEGVTSNAQWHNSILDLAGTVTRSLRMCPRVRGDEMDLRTYFATKLVPESGSPESCQYLSGVVFRKNLAHRRMRSNIANPRILLLGCALEYDRVARMSAFDTLVAQEEEFIKIQVGKIIRLSPDVVVVEKTVSRLAQALLLDANITLLLNVKRSVLEKLSRFTQTSILFSTDFAAHFEDRLGSCLAFRTETIKLQGEKALHIGAGRKPEATLVYFQGQTSMNPITSSNSLVPSLYCTIVLRGEHEELLRKIKRVLTRIIELAHSLALQCAFQDDSCTTFPDQLVTKEIASYTREIAQAQAMEPTSITCIPCSPFVVLPPLKKSALQKLRQPDSRHRALTPDEGEGVQRVHTPGPGVGYESVPWLQQGIVFNSCYLTKRGQCCPPQLDAVDFFRSHSDKSMGDFLIQNCFEQQLRCVAATCKAKNKRHVVALTHSSGTILILAKKIPRTEMPKPSRSQTPLPSFLRRSMESSVTGTWAPQAPWKDYFRPVLPDPSSYAFDTMNDDYSARNPRIMMWSLCKACDKNVTPCVAMSDAAFDSSFAQFLDNTFNNAQLVGRTGKCGHVVRDNHVRFFGLNPPDQLEDGLVVAFEYHPISLYRVLIDTTVTYNWAQTFALRSGMLIELGQVALMCFQGFDTKLCEVEEILGHITDRVDPNVIVLLTRLKRWILNEKEVFMVVLTSYPEKPRASEAPLITAVAVDSVPAVTTSTLTSAPAPELSESDPNARTITLTTTTIPVPPLTPTPSAAQPTTPTSSVVTMTIQCGEGLPETKTPTTVPVTQTVTELDIFDLSRLQRRLFVNFTKYNKMLRTLVAYTTELLLQDKPEEEKEKEPLPALDELIAGSLSAVMRTPNSPTDGVSTTTNMAALSKNDRIRDLLGAFETAVGVLTKPKNRGVAAKPTGPVLATPKLTGSAGSEAEDKGLLAEAPVRHRTTSTPDLERLHSLDKAIGLIGMSDTTTNLPQDAFEFLYLAPDQSSFYFTTLDGMVAHVDCPVYDDEPSSVITRCLSSVEHYNLVTKGMPWEEVVFSPFAEDSAIRVEPEDSVKAEVEELQNEIQICKQHLKRATNLGVIIGAQARRRKRATTTARTPGNPGFPQSPSFMGESKATNPTPPLTPATTPSIAPAPATLTVPTNTVPATTAPTTSTTSVTSTTTSTVPASTAPATAPATTPATAPATSASTTSAPSTSPATTASTTSTAPAPVATPATSATSTTTTAAATSASAASPALAGVAATPVASAPPPTPFAAFSPSLNSANKSAPVDPLPEVKTDKPIEDWTLEEVMADRQLLKSVEEILLCANQPEDIETVFENAYQERDEETIQNTGGGKMEFVCKAFYARQFHALRYMCCEGGEFQFMQSLSRGNKWKATGGKSGSKFAKTKDGRYVLKYVSGHEFRMFLDYAPQYFAHMAKAIFHQLPSALVRILGVFQIKILSKRTDWANSSKVKSKYAVVTPNLFYDRKPDRVFDLKGSMRNRYAKDTALGSRAAVQLDQNFMEFTRACTEGLPRRYEQGLPSALFSSAKELLAKAVFNDTIFLSQNEVVDYSILVGFDLAKHEVVVGVIDYIRKYTWDKKLETGVKSVGMIAGKELPTVIAPSSYKSRFRKAMDHYFMNVPSHITHTHLLGLPHTSLRHAYRAAEAAAVRNDKETGEKATTVRGRLGHLEHSI